MYSCYYEVGFFSFSEVMQKEVFRIIIVGSSCTSDYKRDPISHYPKWLVMDLVPKHWLVRNRGSKSEIQQDNLH